MTKRATTVWQNFLRISLWFASAGLMLASSGLDGAYLTKLMPVSWGWLGLVLNTVSDVVSEIVMYWYGRLQMDASKTKQKMARWLLLPQILLVGYAWLFGWRQLLPIMQVLEPVDYRWLSPLVAGFVPVGIVSVGFVQALLAGRIERERTQASTSKPRAEPKPAVPATPFACPQCERAFASQAGLNAHMRSHKAKANGHKPARELEEVAT